jgi:hypothetical protein
MNAATYSCYVSLGHLRTPRDTSPKARQLCLFSMTNSLPPRPKRKSSYRLIGVTTKLSPREVEDIEGLARKHGLQRGEFIRQLILDELACDSGDPPVSPELVEIIGVRLMLTNLLKPLTTGQKITPEVFDGIIAEVKKHKRSLAIKTRTDLEKD